MHTIAYLASFRRNAHVMQRGRRPMDTVTVAIGDNEMDKASDTPKESVYLEVIIDVATI